MVGEDFCFGELPSRDPPPGFYRFISPEQIKLVIEMVTRTSLFPVTIEERKDLSLAPPKKMEFNEIGKELNLFLHRLQLSRNLKDSPRFADSVPCPGRL